MNSQAESCVIVLQQRNRAKTQESKIFLGNNGNKCNGEKKRKKKKILTTMTTHPERKTLLSWAYANYSGCFPVKNSNSGEEKSLLRLNSHFFTNANQGTNSLVLLPSLKSWFLFSVPPTNNSISSLSYHLPVTNVWNKCFEWGWWKSPAKRWRQHPHFMNTVQFEIGKKWIQKICILICLRSFHPSVPLISNTAGCKLTCPKIWYPFRKTSALMNLLQVNKIKYWTSVGQVMLLPALWAFQGC